MYIGKRIAKEFEQEEDGQPSVDTFFGTIDRLASHTEPLLWHVQVRIFAYEDDFARPFCLGVDSVSLKHILSLTIQRKHQHTNEFRDDT